MARHRSSRLILFTCDAHGPKEGALKEEETASKEAEDQKGARVFESCFVLLGSCVDLTVAVRSLWWRLSSCVDGGRSRVGRANQLTNAICSPFRARLSRSSSSCEKSALTVPSAHLLRATLLIAKKGSTMARVTTVKIVSRNCESQTFLLLTPSFP